MKKALKAATCLLLIGVACNCLAQQATSTTQPGTKKVKKHTQKKDKAVDNKIAVSDQAQPGEKSNKKQVSKKDKAVSNK